jgi:sulfatase maturation enzyme AslB (radical SAM superfamily)
MPGNNRIAMIPFDEAKPFIDEALELGVEQFSFTGGEPFVNPDMVRILAYALDHRPCMVLTNGTEPTMNRWGEILRLKDKSNPLSFRVSIDFPDPVKHDAGRGRGNFRKSLRCIRMMHEAGFAVSVARLSDPDEDRATVEAAYRTHFCEAGVPEDIRFVAFPDFLPPGSHADVPHITEGCMTKYLTAEQRSSFMCNFSKMIVKTNDSIGVYACTLVDDDKDYSLGSTLREAMDVRVMMRHHRCYSCFAYGASCSEQ